MSNRISEIQVREANNELTAKSISHYVSEICYLRAETALNIIELYAQWSKEEFTLEIEDEFEKETITFPRLNYQPEGVELSDYLPIFQTIKKGSYQDFLDKLKEDAINAYENECDDAYANGEAYPMDTTNYRIYTL